MPSLYECVSKPSKACEAPPADLRSYAGTLTQVDASWPAMTPIRFDGRPHSRGYSAKQSAAIAELSYADL